MDIEKINKNEIEDYHILTKEEEKMGDLRLQKLFIRFLGFFFFIGSLILIYKMLSEGLQDGSCKGWGGIVLFIFFSLIMLFGLLFIVSSFLKVIISKKEKILQRSLLNQPRVGVERLPWV